MTPEGLRVLTGELAAVVRRHTPSWTEPADRDPGVTLIDLFAWLADVLTVYQDQIADQAALDARRRLGVIVHHVLLDACLVVVVDGVRWQPMAVGTQATPGERAYGVKIGADGTATLVFGDAGTGARPPADGSEVVATYRSGAGPVGVTATFRWPPDQRAVTVRLGGGGVAFEPARPRRRGLLARLLACVRR